MKKYLITLMLLFSPGLVHAGLTVTPARYDLSVSQGDIFKSSYSVRNDYGLPVDIKVEFRNWFVLPENKGVDGAAASEWLSVEPSSLHLLPGESKSVEYIVKVSTSVKGLLVGMISFVPDTKEEKGITLVVSVSVFVKVAGTEIIDWKISDVKLSAVQGKLQVTANVINEGNIHLRPAGFVEIFSKGKIVARMGFKESRPVYPRLSRLILAESDRAVSLKKGKYTALVSVKCLEELKTKKIKLKVKSSGEIQIK